MIIKNFKPVLNLFLVATACYSIHKLVFYCYKEEIHARNFHYSIEVLYLLFSALSILIVTILIKIKQKSIDNVGMVFLILTSIKMFIAFAFLYPILAKSVDRISFEKTNFFVIFILFLAIETVITIRILNNNQ